MDDDFRPCQVQLMLLTNAGIDVIINMSDLGHRTDKDEEFYGDDLLTTKLPNNIPEKLTEM